MSTATEPFVMPEVSPHTPIMVAALPGASPVPGYVTKVKNSTVSAFTIQTGPGGGLSRFETCYHRDDPRIKTRPHLLEDPTCGIFWIADAELERRKLVRDMAALKSSTAMELKAMNTLLEEMVARLSTLEAAQRTPNAMSEEIRRRFTKLESDVAGQMAAKTAAKPARTRKES
jgi:hypothetical protein